MKKFFLFALLALITLSTNANNRKWDFTKWSPATIANLKAGAGQVSPASNWSDIEKSTATAPTDLSKENCFWEVTAKGNATTGAVLQANGQNIAEFDGLLYTNTTGRSLAIALNYQTPNSSSTFGPYEGPTYLWLGSSKKNYFVIPNVKAGATIKMGVESHKLSDARGVNLYVVAKGAYNTLGTQLKDADGNVPAAPTKYEDQTWVVPEEGLTDTPNEDGTYDVMIYNTNGCHLYYIEVNEGGDVEATKNIAWVTGDISTDMPYVVRPTDNINYTDILASATDVSADSLRTFDAVIVSSNVTEYSPMAKLLAENIAYVPMVNLNPNIFGYIPADVANKTLTAVDPTSEFFVNTGIDEKGNFDYTNLAVALPEKFASDDILAKNGDAVAIHQHKADRNSYILLPTNDEVVEKTAWLALLPNALSTVAATKKKVTDVATPTITPTYADGVTTVTIKCSTSGSVIKYAIGEGDWNTYTEPFTMTKEGTVYAYATAEGYNPMTEETAVSQDIVIKSQSAAPQISMTYDNGSSTISMSADEGAVIYYSFSGQTTADHAATYTEPIVVNEPGTVTAFAVVEGKLNSATVSSDFIVVGAPAVKDTLSHFTANEADWFTNAQVTYYNSEGTLVEKQAIADAITAGVASGAAKAVYYFGKSAWKYYSDEVDHTEIVYAEDGKTPLKGQDGNDSIKVVYKVNPQALKIVSSTSNTDWIIKSEGQAITGETNQGPAAGVSNNVAGRYAATAVDEIGAKPTTGFVDFGGKTSGEPYTMRFESTKQFSGEMDVVAYLGNGGTSDIYIALQKSADGATWETVDTLNYTTSQRFYKKTRIHMNEATPVYLRVAQLGGGSKGYIYDIYVIRTEGLVTGIQNVNAETTEKQSSTRKLFRNGQLIIVTPRGTYNAVGAQLK